MRSRRPTTPAFVLALALLAVGCGGSTQGTGPSPTGSGDGAGGECSPSGTTLQIAAKNVAFDKSCLAAPAGQAFTIQFNNEDSGVPHNVAILSGSEELFKGEIVNGPNEITYDVDALEAGNYEFHCDVHPNMHGTFVVA